MHDRHVISSNAGLTVCVMMSISLHNGSMQVYSMHDGSMKMAACIMMAR